MHSAASSIKKILGVASLVLLLVATTLAVPLHMATHGPLLSAQGQHGCGGQGVLLLGPEGYAGHVQGDEACAICQGFTRIVGTLPMVSSTGLELTGQSGASGSPGSVHSIPTRQDFQRGPPRKGAPVSRA